MEEGLKGTGPNWDAPVTGQAVPLEPLEGLRGSTANSKESTQTDAGIEATPRRKPGRPPQTKTCRVCALDLAAAGLKGYYLVSAPAGQQDEQGTGWSFLQFWAMLY